MKACIICKCTEDRACVTEGQPCGWSPMSLPEVPICTACEPVARLIYDAVDLFDAIPF